MYISRHTHTHTHTHTHIACETCVDRKQATMEFVDFLEGLARIALEVYPPVLIDIANVDMGLVLFVNGFCVSRGQKLFQTRVSISVFISFMQYIKYCWHLRHVHYLGEISCDFEKITAQYKDLSAFVVSANYMLDLYLSPARDRTAFGYRRRQTPCLPLCHPVHRVRQRGGLSPTCTKIIPLVLLHNNSCLHSP